MSEIRLIFNPPPGWPKPPDGWVPPKGWAPDPSWPPAPDGWQLWLPTGAAGGEGRSTAEESDATGGSTPVDHPEPPLSSGSEDAQRRIGLLEGEVAALRAQLEAVATTGEVVVLNDEWVLQEVGIYRYHHPLESAAAYKDKLGELSARIADLVKSKAAIEMSNTFTYDNSLAKGRRMSADLAKLMLRAYNAEVDSSIRALRAGNVVTAKKRVEASRESIKRLGRMMQMQIGDPYHALRLEEVELTADFMMKKQEEKEAAREERERLREERKVEAELAAEREKLTKERNHLMNALAALQRDGTTDAELESRLAAVDEAIVQNDFRAANIRAGYVYVISNRGAFGPGVVKIGLTRRLEPLNRINELGGASVPFRFDVHCLIFSEDAVGLETELHHQFNDRRVNHANTRKEFFFVDPGEVREALGSKVGTMLEFVEHAESTEYLQSIHYWPENRR